MTLVSDKLDYMLHPEIQLAVS